MRLLQIRTSDNPVEKNNAAIISMLQDLRGELVITIREQSKRISDLQSQIDMHNESKAGQIECPVIEPEWEHFKMILSSLDRERLVGLLDEKMNDAYRIKTTLIDPFDRSYYSDKSYYSANAVTAGSFGFLISEELSGSIKIEFQFHTITISKDDLKAFRDYLATPRWA